MKKLEVIVDSRLRFNPTTLDPKCVKSIVEAFTYRNPEYYKKQAMGFWVGEMDDTIVTYTAHDNGELSVPRGATKKLRTVLKEHGYKVRFHDGRTEGNPGLRGLIPPHQVTLYDYQEDSVVASIKKENCLVRAPTGSGKTTAALATASRLNLPSLIIVYNGGLFDQWLDRCVAELGLAKKDIGQIRGGKYSLKPITIAMQQSLNKLSDEKWDELNATFGVVICDEVQRFAAKTFQSTIDRLTARYRIGISADEKRKDKKEFLIYDVFGEVAYTVSRDLLIKREFVHDVAVRIVPTDFEADWYGDAIDAGEVPNHTQLLGEMVKDKARNELIMKWALGEVELENQTIAFSHRRDHCVELNSMAAASGVVSGVLIGGQSAADTHEFKRTVQRIRDGELWFAAGTYQAIGQGLDLPSVSRGLCTTPIATNKQVFSQARGRLCRTSSPSGKENAVMYYFWDRLVFSIEHVKNLAKWNNDVTILQRGSFIPVANYIEKGNPSAYAKPNEKQNQKKLYFFQDRIKR